MAPQLIFERHRNLSHKPCVFHNNGCIAQFCVENVLIDYKRGALFQFSVMQSHFDNAIIILMESIEHRMANAENVSNVIIESYGRVFDEHTDSHTHIHTYAYPQQQQDEIQSRRKNLLKHAFRSARTHTHTTSTNLLWVFGNLACEQMIFE